MHTMDMENYNIHYDFDNIEVPRSTHLNIEIWELLVPENLFYNERCVGGTVVIKVREVEGSNLTLPIYIQLPHKWTSQQYFRPNIKI